MKKINENQLAKKISLSESGKVSINIAQIKEVLKLTFDYLAEEWNKGNEEGVIALIKRHSNNR